MADPLSGIVVGKIANQAFETIKNARDFVPTLEKSIETSKDLDPLVEQIKGSHYSLGRPREEMERLEKYTDNKELIRKSKKLSLNLWKFLLFSGQRAKLLKQYEAFQRYLSIVQIENKRDLMEVLTHLKDNNNHVNQIRGLYGAPQDPEFIGMVKQFNELKAELMKDGASVLVLTGLGGSGKTTLAKKLCWDPQIKGKFGENIFFVTVSKTPNLKNIVQTLFEHCGCRVPEFQTDDDAINRLGLLLRQVGRNPILLVLDDVWPNSEGLVEKFKFQMSDYKILVTSRVAFRRFGTPFELDPLDRNHAVSLFHHFAQLNHSSTYMPDRNLVREIVKGCKGSPLVIQVIAGSLCKQPFEKWQNMKERLKSKTVLESNITDLLCYLQQSLDISDDINEKECFMDTGLFPEDQRIPVTAPIDLPAELHNSEEDGAKAIAIDNDLITRNLINVIGSSSEKFVYKICAGCNAEICHGRFLSCMGGVWHPPCFVCHACHLPITDFEFSMSSNSPYHKSCYREKHHPRCDVCKNFIPVNSAGLIEFRVHPFWIQKYCPTHELDGTPSCCSCERMEPKDSKYLLLDDGRKLCLECLDSAIMDNDECQPLYREILEFYEGLNMKMEGQVPMLLVERQALKEAIEGEKNGHYHLPETRGLCLSEELTVTTILRRPIIGAGYRVTDMITKPYKLTRRCEVTAILVLYGLPRLLTGSILAHEIMHAWLRLKGYPNLRPEVEEGICHILAHMWLGSELYSGSGSNDAPSSSSSSSSMPPSSSASSKKAKRTDFEKKLCEFFKNQIESDTSPAYGDGFRSGYQAVLKYGLESTLDHMHLTGTFPC